MDRCWKTWAPVPGISREISIKVSPLLLQIVLESKRFEGYELSGCFCGFGHVRGRARRKSAMECLFSQYVSCCGMQERRFVIRSARVGGLVQRCREVSDQRQEGGTYCKVVFRALKFALVALFLYVVLRGIGLRVCHHIRRR